MDGIVGVRSYVREAGGGGGGSGGTRVSVVVGGLLEGPDGLPGNGGISIGVGFRDVRGER